ncbi:unnamed protein product [Owenia fusiformis]|uniref:Uncharacterized protein n=1 Tax=Owenia fusiformis TaxID=6347 RepID=A0A8J1TMZ8_OWEFU|nr:unnamed protein product [Owenia fusiformis]
MLSLSGQIYRFDQVPDHFKELFIISGYRHPKSSPQQCILSIFDATNETLNFWTHFLPTLFFIWKLRALAEVYDFTHDAYSWPLLAYMFCLCVYPLTSAIAHIFNCMSDRARHFCFFLDYAALSIYGLGSAIAYRAYVFPEGLIGTTFGNMYLYVAILNSILSMMLCCETRFMDNFTKKKKILRMGSMMMPYFFDSIPVVYRLFVCDGTECDLRSTHLLYRQFFFAAGSAFLYSTHLPERIFPGTFDIIGHSHQLFHICSVMGTFDQMNAILYDMVDRREFILANDMIPSFSLSIGAMLLSLALILLLLACFTYRLYNMPIHGVQTHGKHREDMCSCNNNNKKD